MEDTKGKKRKRDEEAGGRGGGRGGRGGRGGGRGGFGGGGREDGASSDLGGSSTSAKKQKTGGSLLAPAGKFVESPGGLLSPVSYVKCCQANLYCRSRRHHALDLQKGRGAYRREG